MSEETGPGNSRQPDESVDSEIAKRLLADALGETPQADQAPPQAAPSLSEIAADFPQFEIIELIGRGGMGAVYKARQLKLDRIVALKVLHDKFSRDPQFVERFTREARALARLNHPNIVSLYDFGDSNGRLFFVMEFVDGPNLRQVIQARTLSPDQALGIVPKLCDALQYAHEEGIIHRDIKPENVLLDQRGRVKIADFGLAKLMGEAPPGHTLTATGTVMGTPHYMAPEQLETPGSVDHRADVFALGVVFYEMLTGELPLGRFQPPSRKCIIDVRLDEVVLRAMEREPERRYQHASEVRSEVEAITSTPQTPPKTPPLSGSQPPHEPGNGMVASRLAATAGAALSLTIAGILLPLFLLRVAAVVSPGNGRGIAFVWFLPVALFPLIGMFLGFSSAIRIRDSGGRLRGLGLAIFAILIVPTIIVGLVASRIWRFIYAVGVAMDKQNFWKAIGRPVYSVADANSEVYWLLGAATGVLFAILGAWLLTVIYSPKRTVASGALPSPIIAGKPGKGPMPLWYLLLILIAAAMAVVFGLSVMGRSSSGSSRSTTIIHENRSRYVISWQVQDESGKVLQPRGSSRTMWSNTNNPGHLPGSWATDKFGTTTDTLDLQLNYLGNLSGNDRYHVTMVITSPSGQSRSTSEISYDGTVQALPEILGYRVFLGPRFPGRTPSKLPQGMPVTIE